MTDTEAAVTPIGFWGRRPLYAAKIGTRGSDTVVVRRKRTFATGDSIKFAASADRSGMCVGVAPRYHAGIIDKIEGNRLFIDLL